LYVKNGALEQRLLIKMVIINGLVLMILFPIDALWLFLTVLLLIGVSIYAFRLYLQFINLQGQGLKLEAQKITLANKIGERIKEVEKQADELETLDQIVRIINKDIDLELVLRNLLLQGIQLIPQAESGAFLVYDPSHKVFRIGAVFGYELEDVENITFTIEEATQRYALPVDRIKEGVYIVPGVNPNRVASEKVSALPSPKSMLAMTIMVNGQLEGFIIFDSFSNYKAFNEADLQRLARFRDHAIPAFTKAHFLQEIKAQSDEMATLDRIVRIVNQEMELSRVLQSLLDQGLELISNAESGAFLNWEEDKNLFVVAAAVGYTKQETDFVSFTWEEALARYTDAQDQVFEGVYLIHPMQDRIAGQKLIHINLPKAMLTMPIRVEEKLVGFLIFESFSSEKAFSQKDIYRLLRFRDHAVSAFSKAKFLRAIQSQKNELEKANAVINKKNMDLMMAYEIIELKNKDITDSIQYAKRIQEALLPGTADFNKVFPHAFILYLPKDIVSGDFYWYYQKDDVFVWAAVDCTGHGVPGAFMSVIGSTVLNHIVIEQGITNPASILNYLNKEVKLILKQTEVSTQKTYDGMEVGLCSYDAKKNTITFAGANRPLYFVRNNELIEIKGDKIPIGAGPFQSSGLFTDHVFELQPGDAFYLSSDGYGDQFGGSNDRKFTTKKLKDMILQTQSYSLADQQKILHKVLDDWRGKTSQTDDILIIGIQI
jgi:serine phosphatase RsbU (regulator of sigma subunit)